MRRGALRFLALLSGLLCLAFVALWVRSYWALDSVFFESIDHGYLISSSQGRIRAFRRDAVYGSGGVLRGSYPPLTFSEATAPGRREILGISSGASTFNGAPARWIIVPLWVLSVITAILPAMWLWHWRRMARRVRAGFCRACGYDLRATPQQCPECGALAGDATLSA
jgi:hypothetical protein